MMLKKIKKLRDGRKTFFNRGPFSENTSKYKKCTHALIHIYLYIYIINKREAALYKQLY